MAGNVFEPTVQGALPISDITPLTNGGATDVLDTSVAKGLTAAGAFAEKFARSYLNNKAADAAKSMQTFGMSLLQDGELGKSPLTSGEKVANGEADAFTVDHAGVADESMRKLLVLKEAQRQGGTPSGTLALAIESELKRVSSITPGWADDIKKFAITELGYDPGAFFMRSQLQKEQLQQRESFDIRAEMRGFGIDPANPNAMTQLDSANARATRQREVSQTLTDSKKAMDILLAQKKLGAVDDVEFKAKVAKLSFKNMHAATGGIGAELSDAHSDSLEQLKFAFDDKGVMVNQELYQEVRDFNLQEIAQLRSSLSAGREDSLTSGVPSAAVNAAYNPLVKRLDNYEKFITALDVSKALTSNTNIEEEVAISELAALNPDVRKLMAFGKSNVGVAGASLSQSVGKTILQMTSTDGTPDPIKTKEVADAVTRLVTPKAPPPTRKDLATAGATLALLRTMSAVDLAKMPADEMDVKFTALSRSLSTVSEDSQGSLDYHNLHSLLTDNADVRASFIGWLNDQPDKDRLVEGLQAAASLKQRVTLNAFEDSLDNFLPRTFKIGSGGEIVSSVPTGRIGRQDYTSTFKAAKLLNSGLSDAGEILTEALPSDATRFNRRIKLLVNRVGADRFVIESTGLPLQFNQSILASRGTNVPKEINPKDFPNIYVIGQDIYRRRGQEYTWVKRAERSKK